MRIRAPHLRAPQRPAPPAGAGGGRRLPRKRWLALGAVAAVAAVAVGMALGRSTASGLLPAQPSGSAPGAAAAPPGFVRFRAPEAEFSISYPSSWERLEPRSRDVELIAASGDGASLLVRTVPLAFELPDDRLAPVRDLADRFVGRERSVELLAEPEQVELGGLPGLAYLYSFRDRRSDRRGTHLHLFLVDGDRMITVVMQALPMERFRRAAPVFDRIAASLRVE